MLEEECAAAAEGVNHDIVQAGNCTLAMFNNNEVLALILFFGATAALQGGGVGRLGSGSCAHSW